MATVQLPLLWILTLRAVLWLLYSYPSCGFSHYELCCGYCTVTPPVDSHTTSCAVATVQLPLLWILTLRAVLWLLYSYPSCGFSHYELCCGYCTVTPPVDSHTTSCAVATVQLPLLWILTLRAVLWLLYSYPSCGFSHYELCCGYCTVTPPVDSHTTSCAVATVQLPLLWILTLRAVLWLLYSYPSCGFSHYELCCGYCTVTPPVDSHTTSCAVATVQLPLLWILTLRAVLWLLYSYPSCGFSHYELCCGYCTVTPPVDSHTTSCAVATVQLPLLWILTLRAVLWLLYSYPSCGFSHYELCCGYCTVTPPVDSHTTSCAVATVQLPLLWILTLRAVLWLLYSYPSCGFSHYELCCGYCTVTPPVDSHTTSCAVATVQLPLLWILTLRAVLWLLYSYPSCGFSHYELCCGYCTVTPPVDSHTTSCAVATVQLPLLWILTLRAVLWLLYSYPSCTRCRLIFEHSVWQLM